MGPTLALCWPRLALSCPYVGPMFAYVGLRETFGALSVPSNANPHSSDWEGLGKGWGSAAGAAALITFGYYRRPPARTRASGRRCFIISPVKEYSKRFFSRRVVGSSLLMFGCKFNRCWATTQVQRAVLLEQCSLQLFTI